MRSSPFQIFFQVENMLSLYGWESNVHLLIFNYTFYIKNHIKNIALPPSPTIRVNEIFKKNTWIWASVSFSALETLYESSTIIFQKQNFWNLCVWCYWNCMWLEEPICILLRFFLCFICPIGKVGDLHNVTTLCLSCCDI